MVKSVNDQVDNCLERQKIRGHCRHQRHLKLIPASRPLEFFAIPILVRSLQPMINSISSWQTAISSWQMLYLYLRRQVRMIYRLLSKNRLLPTAFPTSPSWIMDCSSWANFSTLSAASQVPNSWRRQRITCTLIAKTEQYNQTIVARLCQDVNEHQSNQDLFFQLLAYVNNRQVRRTLGMTPFCLSPTLKPPECTLPDLSAALLHDAPQPISAELLYLYILNRLSLMHKKTEKMLNAGKLRYKQ